MGAFIVFMLCVGLGLCLALPIVRLIRRVDRTNPRRRVPPRDWRSA